MTQSKFVSAYRQRISTALRAITGVRRSRWAAGGAAGAAMLALAAAAQQFAQPSDGPAPAVAAAPALDLAAIKAPNRPVTEAALAMPKPTPVKLVRVMPSNPAKTATVSAVPDAAAPAEDDPRWAREVTRPNATALPRIEPEPAALPAVSDPGERDGVGSGDELLDPVETASLPARADDDTIEPALEIPLPPQNDLAPTPREEAAAEPAKPASGKTSRVTDHVNMRSAPRAGSTVLTVVPADAVIEVMDCGTWCEIRYEGRTGFVFNEYVNEAGAKAAAKPKAAKRAAAAKPKEPKRAAPTPAAAKPAAPNRTSAQTAAAAQPAATLPNALAPAAGAAQARPRTGILTCGIFRQCETYGPSNASQSASGASPAS